MGFTSMDDFVNKVSGGNFLRYDWNKITVATPYVVGRWYDLAQLGGTPIQHRYGEISINGTLLGTIAGWTADGTGFAYGANTIVKTSGTGVYTASDSVYIAIQAGHFYRITYNITAISGTITPSIGGTNGAGQTTTGIKTEIITATNTTGIRFTFALAANTCTWGNISVVEWGTSSGTITPMAQLMTDTNGPGRMYTGGNVSTLTKHVVNAGVVCGVSMGALGVFMLVDQIIAYPYFDGTSTSAQTCYNTNVIPDTRGVGTAGGSDLGKGVRAFLVSDILNPLGAGVPTVTINYVNQSGAAKAVPFLLNTPASCIQGSLFTTGVAAGNYGPFVPLAAGDTGIRSITNVTLSATTAGTTPFFHVVLCRPILSLPITTLGVMAERDFMNQLPSLPRIYDGSDLQWLFFAGAATVAANNWYGYLDFAWA
jgi:hypothetical protein